jgi:short subunit dehydrogenase-like uncharacterized protein
MKDFDIVVFGATGFTGQQAARYLAERAPKGLRVALAARRRDALEAVAGPLGFATIVADSEDAASIGAMVARARVIASTAGPFRRYSDPVVAACVEHGSDYCDITGEVAWVRTLVDRFHDRAAAAGCRIVPFCGYDSVPSDLGAWAMADWIRREWGQPTKSVTAAFSARGGGLNGGTAASALDGAESGGLGDLLDPIALNPPSHRSEADRQGLADRRWPSRDAERGRWLAPFVMAPVNTRVVRRSAALLADEGHPYGDGFTYDEAFDVRSGATAWGIAAGLALAPVMLGTGLGRSVVRRFVPKPGEGPSEEARREGSIRTRYVAEAADGRVAEGELTFPGDAGNVFTVTALCESALALAVDRDRLPARAGLLTPATALDGVLLERLKAAGMGFEIRGRPPASASARTSSG